MAKRQNKSPKLDKARRPVAVVIKGNPEWREWVERLAKHCRMSVSALGDLAFVHYAKHQGFNEKPPER